MAKKVKEFKENDIIENFLLVTQCERRTASNDKVFLRVSFGDNTGTLTGCIWDDVERFQEICKPGEIVKVTGRVSSYEGKPQLKVSDVRARFSNEEVDLSEFCRATPYDVSAMWEELETYRASIKDPFIIKLLAKFFAGESGARFRNATAAKKMHHAYVGGLLEHTLGVVRMCADFCERYPKLQRDLLLAGAFLHDIGKLQEMTGGSATEYTRVGLLKGHLVIGSELVGKAADEIEDFPEEYKLELQHMLLSHHGKLEFGSPILPQTPEALALSRADDADAHFYQLFAAIADEKETPGDFTSKIFGLDTSVLKTEAAKASEPLSMAAPKKKEKKAPAEKAKSPEASFFAVDPAFVCEEPKKTETKNEQEQIDLF